MFLKNIVFATVISFFLSVCVESKPPAGKPHGNGQGPKDKIGKSALSSAATSPKKADGPAGELTEKQRAEREAMLTAYAKRMIDISSFPYFIEGLRAILGELLHVRKLLESYIQMADAELAEVLKTEIMSVEATLRAVRRIGQQSPIVVEDVSEFDKFENNAQSWIAHARAVSKSVADGLSSTADSKEEGMEDVAKLSESFKTSVDSHEAEILKQIAEVKALYNDYRSKEDAVIEGYHTLFKKRTPVW